MWFWDVSPKYWTPVQWTIMVLTACIMIVIMFIGCGIESIVDLIL